MSVRWINSSAQGATHLLIMNKLICFCFFLFVFTKPVKLDNDDNSNDFHVIHVDGAKPNHNVKIIDLIAKQIKQRQFFYAIEVSPNPYFILDYNLFETKRTKPLFTSITWHLPQGFGHNVSLMHDVAPYRMFEQINSKHPALLHLTCHRLSEANLDTILRHNVTNILAVRGDSYHPLQIYQHAVHLVTAIRGKPRFNTTIGVGAYPEKHYDAVSFEADLLYLKEKTDAGADFIITQICFSAAKIIKFIDAAHAINITVPIIPGILIPRTYQQLKLIAQWISIEIPSEMRTRLEPFKDDSEIFRPAMIQMIVELIHELRQYSEESSDFRIPGVQLFTLNRLENVLDVIDGAQL